MKGRRPARAGAGQKRPTDAAEIEAAGGLAPSKQQAEKNDTIRRLGAIDAKDARTFAEPGIADENGGEARRQRASRGCLCRSEQQGQLLATAARPTGRGRR